MEGNAQVTWQAIRYVERILCGAGVAYLAGYAQAMSAAAAGLSGLSAGGSSAAAPKCGRSTHQLRTIEKGRRCGVVWVDRG